MTPSPPSWIADPRLNGSFRLAFHFTDHATYGDRQSPSAKRIQAWPSSDRLTASPASLVYARPDRSCASRRRRPPRHACGSRCGGDRPLHDPAGDLGVSPGSNLLSAMRLTGASSMARKSGRMRRRPCRYPPPHGTVQAAVRAFFSRRGRAMVRPAAKTMIRLPREDAPDCATAAGVPSATKNGQGQLCPPA